MELILTVQLMTIPLMSGVMLNDFIYVMVSEVLFIILVCPTIFGTHSICSVQWAAAR